MLIDKNTLTRKNRLVAIIGSSIMIAIFTLAAIVTFYICFAETNVAYPMDALAIGPILLILIGFLLYVLIKAKTTKPID
jgi:hypothetical protein